MRAARAALLISLARPIKFLICGVVVAVPVTDAKAPFVLFEAVAWFYLIVNEGWKGSLHFHLCAMPAVFQSIATRHTTFTNQSSLEGEVINVLL